MDLIVTFTTDLVFLVHRTRDNTSETLFRAWRGQPKCKTIVKLNLPSQVVPVSDFDFIQLLVIDRQDNALDGVQEKQPIRTHFFSEGIQ
jgi:hypothetical protein